MFVPAVRTEITIVFRKPLLQESGRYGDLSIRLVKGSI